jgi:endonuclease III
MTSKISELETELLSSRTQSQNTENVYRQIVANLTMHYPYLQQYYNLNEDAVADKIVEIAQKICSKI